ncbi:ABC transporter permease [Desulfobulbus rhabdoformis]|uniref:ABC transporter permease n=1 Tax=Desulfobulbus rhabdoformis TaxID=34032 RepID=UPI001965DED6|nr:ABC transporter permease [Desulfobulbus rhabdoformis]MBM9614573.1 ABC transporter permease [Desulfobulbus rhabdoformis]
MRLANIFHLGCKELHCLIRDPILLFLIVYAFTVGVYAAGIAIPETLNRAPISIVDEDDSPLSERIAAAFYLPHFLPPVFTTLGEMDSRMDAGYDTFAINIPPDFQRDLLAGRPPTIQLNIDATRMSQAFTGNNYIQTIINNEVSEYYYRYRGESPTAASLAMRARFNQSLTQIWFGAVMEVINNVTMLSIILIGASLIREREHSTVEHLLVMPVTPFEIMISKSWSMGLVVLTSCAVSLTLVVQRALAVTIEGSLLLFLAGAALHLFATTALGIFMATVARSMPQFGLLMMLVLLPLQMLSGGVTPRESMPIVIQHVMQLAPTTHFVALAQTILYRGGGIEVVWHHFLKLVIIGTILFILALRRFRKTISLMA